MLFGSASSPGESRWNTWNEPLKWPIRILAVLSTSLVIASQYVTNPALDSAGKSLFWTCIVLVPVLGLNRDLYGDIVAWFVSLVLIGIQILLVKMAWEGIRNWNFIELTAVGVPQLLLFEAPFLLLRRYRGITYPPKQEEPD